jgi:GNAT superfamily N-acetyltransferase
VDTGIDIDRVDRFGVEAAADGLIDLIRSCVDGGASLGFLAPMTVETAAGYWRSLMSEVDAETRILLLARSDGRVVGSGQLRFETKENGRHRAEIAKVMVAPDQRRRGIATGLMARLESAAADAGITLLYLDTSEGPGGARALYETLGYEYAGGVPGYALDPDGTPADNAIFYKWLG